MSDLRQKIKAGVLKRVGKEKLSNRKIEMMKAEGMKEDQKIKKRGYKMFSLRPKETVGEDKERTRQGQASASPASPLSFSSSAKPTFQTSIVTHFNKKLESRQPPSTGGHPSPVRPHNVGLKVIGLCIMFVVYTEYCRTKVTPATSMHVFRS